MSNVNSPGPRKAQETASAYAASSAQGNEVAIRSFLTTKFGSDFAGKVLDSIPAKDKVGKKLSFDTVKKAIMETAEKEGRSVVDKDLEGLKSLFPGEEDTVEEDDPFKNIKEAKESLETGRKQSRQLQDKLDDAAAEAEKKYLEKKNEELQKQEFKKVIDPKKIV